MTTLRLAQTHEGKLAAFKPLERTSADGRVLSFHTILDAYNITSPFNGVIAARVEKRDTELSTVMFFRSSDLKLDLNAPRFNRHQDPFYSYHNGELVFGGVNILSYQNGNSIFRTEFYRGEDIYHLSHFASGPIGEKDIRLVQLDGSIGVLRRPRGGRYGPGRVLYQEIDSLDGLPELLKTLSGRELAMPYDGGWAGANQLFNLGGNIGVLGHIARREESTQNLDYKAMAFSFDSETCSITMPLKVIANVSHFPTWKPPKTQRHDKVVFPGGLVRLPGGKADLYAGIRDTYAAHAPIADPFV